MYLALIKLLARNHFPLQKNGYNEDFLFFKSAFSHLHVTLN